MSFCACRSKRLPILSPVEYYQQQIIRSNVFEQAFTGFALYDLQSQEWLFQQQSGKAFVPASSLKILTLFGVLDQLSDSLPALRYQIRGDSLVFWGTGYPAFLHPNCPVDSSLIQFFTQAPKDLYFSNHNFFTTAYAPGWAWEDYRYTFQSDRAPFPVYGNKIRIEKRRDTLVTQPAFFESYLLSANQLQSAIQRDYASNQLLYNPAYPIARPRELPFKYSNLLFTQLLQDTCQRPIQLYPRPLLPDSTTQTLYLPTRDTLLRRMMLQSDNFLAEQLLLQVAETLSDSLRSEIAIRYLLDGPLADLPDRPVWVDGSGLSRYNLISPRSLVTVLQRLYQRYPWPQLRQYFPQSGRSGTLKSWFEQPYVWAKTGSMSHLNSLSGFIECRSGKILAFCFMHNNYVGSAKEYRKEMESILMSIYAAY